MVMIETMIIVTWTVSTSKKWRNQGRTKRKAALNIGMIIQRPTVYLGSFDVDNRCVTLKFSIRGAHFEHFRFLKFCARCCAVSE